MDTDKNTLLKQELVKPFTKCGNVILSWRTDRSRAFAGIVYAFIKPPATIVDLCAGERRLYSKFNAGETLIGKYKFIFGDIRDIKGNQYVCDILHPPVELYGIADAYIFDPPWPSTSGSLKEMVKKYHPMSKEDFGNWLYKALEQIEKILKPNGILIIKISHPWNHIIYNLLSGRFKWLRDIVQVSVHHNVYLVTYFMIFRKGAIQ